ncbi:MAG: glycosyltransferase family 2 protein [Pseudomonadota bacterium]
MKTLPVGVVIVTFNSGHEAVDCVASLLASAAADGLTLHICVVDNASTDDTVPRLKEWAAGTAPYSAPDGLPFVQTFSSSAPRLVEGEPDLAPVEDVDFTLIHSGGNLGFAGGVNVGLAYLARVSEIEHFWVLNPDSVVPPGSLKALARSIETGTPYALMGGRVVYFDQPDRIQIDGGLIKRSTGVTGNFNLGKSHARSTPPQPSELDFITGASMVASRQFYERTGPMREDYFLYYEEVDWAMRRGDLPLAYCPGLLVYHHGGSSIGSPVFGRTASPFSLYFKHRGRAMFQRRFNPGSMSTTHAYTLAQAARTLLRSRGDFAAAGAILRGGLGLTPPASVLDRLDAATRTRAFGE